MNKGKTRTTGAKSVYGAIAGEVVNCRSVLFFVTLC